MVFFLEVMYLERIKARASKVMICGIIWNSSCMHIAFTSFIQQMNLKSGTVKLRNRCWGWLGTIVGLPLVYLQADYCKKTRWNVENTQNFPLMHSCGTNTIK